MQIHGGARGGWLWIKLIPALMLKNIRPAALTYGPNGMRSVYRARVRIFSALFMQSVNKSFII